MKQLTILVWVTLSTMFFLYAQEKASAFYCLDTGRWLNRDPIGEQAGINLYQFVGNNPIDYVDSVGLKVELFSYGTLGGYSHAYLKITPDNPGNFQDITMQRDPNGNQFFTIGGHPDSFDEYLNGILNNGSDVTGITSGRGTNLGPITRKHCSDTTLIRLLLRSNNNYKNNGSLYYSAYAAGNQYNSNGYASGIIDSVLGQGPDLSGKTTFMGWDNPVLPTPLRRNR